MAKTLSFLKLKMPTVSSLNLSLRAVHSPVGVLYKQHTITAVCCILTFLLVLCMSFALHLGYANQTPDTD